MSVCSQSVEPTDRLKVISLTQQVGISWHRSKETRWLFQLYFPWFLQITDFVCPTLWLFNINKYTFLVIQWRWPSISGRDRGGGHFDRCCVIIMHILEDPIRDKFQVLWDVTLCGMVQFFLPCFWPAFWVRNFKQWYYSVDRHFVSFNAPCLLRFSPCVIYDVCY